MTPAQAKKVFGRTTVKVRIAPSMKDRFDWWAELKIGTHTQAVYAEFGMEVPALTEAKARRHAREFFKKLGLKVRFGK